MDDDRKHRRKRDGFKWLSVNYEASLKGDNDQQEGKTMVSVNVGKCIFGMFTLQGFDQRIFEYANGVYINLNAESGMPRAVVQCLLAYHESNRHQVLGSHNTQDPNRWPFSIVIVTVPMCCIYRQMHVTAHMHTNNWIYRWIHRSNFSYRYLCMALFFLQHPISLTT